MRKVRRDMEIFYYRNIHMPKGRKKNDNKKSDKTILYAI